MDTSSSVAPAPAAVSVGDLVLVRRALSVRGRAEKLLPCFRAATHVKNVFVETRRGSQQDLRTCFLRRQLIGLPTVTQAFPRSRLLKNTAGFQVKKLGETGEEGND